MNATIAIIQEQSKWMTMLASLLTGLLCTTVLDGQEVKCDAAQDIVASSTTLEIVADTVLPAFCDSISQPESADSQFVLTANRCGNPTPVRVLADDEIWRISARKSHCFPCDLSAIECARLQNGGWVDSTLADLVEHHSTDKSKVTLIFAHGNRTDLCWADSRGLQFYHFALKNRCLDRPPVRLVMFAWKSDVESLRPVTDYDAKSERSIMVGQTFGKILCQFDDRNMVVGGFSLGAQVVLYGLSNPELQQQDRVGKFKVVVVAPALTSSYVKSGLRRYPCNPIVEQTDLFLNRVDRAIKIAQILARKRTRSRVTTLRELAKANEAALNPILVHDITDQVGKRHSIVKYAKSSELQRGLTAMLNSVFDAGNWIQGVPEPVIERHSQDELPISDDDVVPTNQD